MYVITNPLSKRLFICETGTFTDDDVKADKRLKHLLDNPKEAFKAIFGRSKNTGYSRLENRQPQKFEPDIVDYICTKIETNVFKWFILFI